MSRAARIAEQLSASCDPDSVVRSEVDFVAYKLYEHRVGKSLEDALGDFCECADAFCSFGEPSSSCHFSELIVSPSAKRLSAAHALAHEFCSISSQASEGLQCILFASKTFVDFLGAFPIATIGELLGEVAPQILA